MRVSRILLATSSVAVCVLLASTTGSAQPSATPSVTQLQQQGDYYVDVAQDRDRDGRPDDDDHNNIPDRSFWVLAKFVLSCGGGLALCTAPGWTAYICLGTAVMNCADRYKKIQ